MANVPTSSDPADSMAAPLGDVIAAVGRGLAEAQQALDAATIDAIKALYAGGDENMEVLRRLGYQPTWYRIPELSAEITMSLSMGAHGTSGDPAQPAAASAGRLRLYASPMDASYTNKYDFDLQAASVIKFKIVPVPPSTRAGEVKVVPALANRSAADARKRLSDLGIPFELARLTAPGGEAQPSPVTVADTETVLHTVPGPGELLDPGEKVQLVFDVTVP